MVYGFKIIDDLVDGLDQYLDKKGFTSVHDLVGKAVPSVTDWQYLNLNHVDKAWIDQDLCIKCGRCYIACEDTSHQAITATSNGSRHFEVIDAECVGCNLCVSVCPVENCITMRPDDQRRRSTHRPRDHAREGGLDHASEQPGAQSAEMQDPFRGRAGLSYECPIC